MCAGVAEADAVAALVSDVDRILSEARRVCEQSERVMMRADIINAAGRRLVQQARERSAAVTLSPSDDRSG